MKKLFVILFLCLAQNLPAQEKDSNELFIASKGKWTIPVKNGKIYFPPKYVYDHPSATGISIHCTTPEAVHSIFDGTVVALTEYDSLFMVVVKYADCFIGYANLSSTTIKKGLAIGYVGKNLDDIYCVEILLYISGQDIDPTDWFTKKEL